MAVGRCRGQCCRFTADFLAQADPRQARTRASADRYPPAQVGQGEAGATVAAVGGADDGVEGFVAADGKDLSVAERPTARSEVAGKHRHAAQQRIPAQVSAWVSPANGDDVVGRSEGLADINTLS